IPPAEMGDARHDRTPSLLSKGDTDHDSTGAAGSQKLEVSSQTPLASASDFWLLTSGLGDLLRYRERLPVVSRAHPLGLRIAATVLLCGLDAEVAAEPILEAVQLQAVPLRQMFLHARQRLIRFLVGAQRLRPRIERDFFAQPIRNIRQVAQC